jgi:hypothetical protein
MGYLSQIEGFQPLGTNTGVLLVSSVLVKEMCAALGPSVYAAVQFFKNAKTNDPTKTSILYDNWCIFLRLKSLQTQNMHLCNCYRLRYGKDMLMKWCHVVKLLIFLFLSLCTRLTFFVSPVDFERMHV